MSSQDNHEIKIQIGAHYLKDLSVENNSAPEIFNASKLSQPQIQVSCDVTSKPYEDKRKDILSFEVMLSINAKSTITDQEKNKDYDLFICEVKYGGIFSFTKSDDKNLQKLLLVYSPNILFPFLRRIVATATGDCGFPPLMLDPIDFAAKFEKEQNQ